MQNGSGGRYVPPHLRGRGSGDGRNKHNPSGNSNNKGINSNASSNRNSNPGSRWKDLGNGNDGNRHGHGARNNASHNNNGNNSNSSRGNHRSAATGNSGGASRWGNVNRSAITEGNGKAYGYGHDTKNNNNKNDDTRRRSVNSMFDRFTSDSKRYYVPRDHHDLSEVKAIFFGDSFIKLFGLLNEYSDSVLKTPRTIEVQKYKAASAKGLYREGNENRTKICQTMDYIRRQNSNHKTNNLNKMYQHLERLVFCFGSVDVHMSFYFKKFAKHQGLTEDDLRDIATNYVDFVAGLETGSSTNPQQQQPLTKLIVGIYPSPLCDKDVGASLLAYGSLETADQVAAVDASDEKTIESRQARVDLFNQTLKERCCFHNEKSAEGGGNGILEYWDVRDEILTLDGDGRPRVKDAYKDVSDLNIHLIHETTLQLWVSKWPWYQALTTSGQDRDSTGFLGYLQETFDEYRKTKPWAERTHVAETSGVRLT